MKKMVVTTKRQHVYPSLGGAVGPHQMPRMLPVRDIEVLLIKGYGVAEELKSGELLELNFDNFNKDNEVVPDTTAPVIKYTGSKNLTVEFGATFDDPAVTATDDKDGTVAVTKVVKKGSTTVSKVDTQVAGAYTITYNAKDAAGNSATPLVINVTVKEKPAEQPTG